MLPIVAMPVQGSEDLYVEAELSPQAPYIQAPVEYRVRLYRALTLSQGSLIMPEQEQLVVEPLPELPAVEVRRDGRLYRLQEHRFLLFPQRSGRLVVEPPVFSGRQAFARGPELVLAVRPRSAMAQEGPWLPAYGLTLNERWRAPEPPWQVGDLLERVITIEAQGLTGAQLPALTVSQISGLELQELAVEVGNRIVDGQMVGWRIQRQRLLASAAGRFELPALRLAWWDLGQDMPRESRLPGRTLEFQALASMPVSVEQGAESPAEAEVEPSLVLSPVWLGALLFGLLVLGLSVLAYRHYLSPGGQHRRRAAALLRQIKEACHDNEPRVAARGLLAWAGHGRDPQMAWTLGHLARQLEGEPARALWQLDACLYRPAEEVWDGARFARIVLPALKGRHLDQTRGPAMVLPPLNP
jgi:hypothetical protein